MSINNLIEGLQSLLRRTAFNSEAAVSQGVLLPTLHELGWPIFDTTIVIPEYSVEGRRVDFALCHPANKPVIFVEVKKRGCSEGADRQLFEYAFHIGIPMAILTDGQEWSFYLPGEQGPYNERRVYKLDLLERSSDEASTRLVRYLAYDQFCSGKALMAARSDYQNVARDREIETTFPKAWQSLLEEQDLRLLDLLAGKVESLCGYKPEPDACSRFLSARDEKVGLGEAGPVKIVRTSVRPNNRESYMKDESVRRSSGSHPTFSIKGEPQIIGSSTEIMIKIFQFFAREDKGFLERFINCKHGTKRRYLAKDKIELYPGRLDLAEKHAVEVLPGWWLGTNNSCENIQKIIDLAIKVAGPELGSLVQAKVI